jgi:hypothetical protein
LDLEICSVTIWGKVFPDVGAPDSSYYRGTGVWALGWSLGASRCEHGVDTPDGGADSRHEWRDGVRIAADSGVGREWPIGPRRAAHGEKQGGPWREGKWGRRWARNGKWEEEG